ncbi:MAG: 4a-hydroxytetrahydrobiopterin dehydratase [Spongiibacteraceae bacterium]
MTTKLALEDIQQRLQTRISDWSLRDGKLYRSIQFPDFATAFGFMTQIAFVAERMDHHPEWLNSYNRVDIWLTTHEVNGISEKDFALAARINAVLG